MRFVDITNDIAFRKIFGNENRTKILISFLNAVLRFEGEDQIVKVQLVNPYQLPRIAGEKASIVDVRATDMKGRQFVIEMQVAEVDGFAKRVQYYAARDYSMQINSGDKYNLLKPTFFIGILDFNYFKGESYLSNHSIADEETHEKKLDDIKYTFIELKKFKLEVHELKTLIEKWVFFIKNAEDLNVIPENTHDEGLLEAYEDADKHVWNKEDLIAYDNAFIAERDKIGRMLFAEKRGLKQGLEQGLQQGEKQMMAKAILGFHANGASASLIAQALSISEEEVQKFLDANLD